MGRIHKLSQALINRISAGECVERPASVVKELVENALDSGATRVDVEVEEGGRALIRVVDNGCGMDVDDLAMCVVPHATSKIQEDDDLFNIHTMGFRGEALASIGSVSRLEITSRPADAELGHSVLVDAGVVGEPTPCSAPVGTKIEVHDLFYCVPARRKFLRTTQTEMGHVTEQFARIALANPGVAMSLRHQGRKMQDLPASERRLQRIRDLYGAELADVLIPVQRGGGGIEIEGFVAPPAQCRKSSKWEYVFVNGRFIRDRFVSHAVNEAYRSLIMPNQRPIVFLFVRVDPREVDVNVHPTKVEVRWRNSNYVHGQVLAAIREKFLATNLEHRFEGGGGQQQQQRVRDALADFFRGAKPTERPGQGGGGPRGGAGGTEGRLPGAAPAERIENREGGASGVGFAREGGPEHGPAPEHAVKSSSEDACPSGGSEAGPAGGEEGSAGERTGWLAGDERPVRAVQIHNTYLVIETADGMMIVDQHALHERILYEELRRRITEHPLESQRLLIPDVVDVPADRLEALETHADILAHVGVELTASGPQSVALHAFPSLLDRLDRRRFVAELLDLLSEQGTRSNPETLVHGILDMMACKAAVKAGDPLSPEEIEALLARRTVAERSSHCPHGRPTTLHFSLAELERRFKRRV